MRSKNLANLKLMTIAFVLLATLSGCAKSHVLPDDIYEAKQIQNSGLESTYVICKKCVGYTNLKKDE